MEVYQKNFPDFIYGNPTSTEESGQDEETETRPGGTTSKEEIQIKESHDLKKVEQLRKRYNQRYHKTLNEGVRKKKTKGNSGTRKGGSYSSTKRRDIQDMASINRTTN